MRRTGLIAKKIGMSALFNESGERITLTLLKVENCVVLGNKTLADNGYNAVVLCGGGLSGSKVSKPLKGSYSKVNVEPRKKIKEFRVSEECLLEVGASLGVDHYRPGQYIDVTGKSIGKGFAGGMKRHGFAGLEASHGVSISHRSHGSTGGCQDPGKVFKNKKMAGHMGDEKVTMQNLQVVEIDKENDLLMVKGSVPGSKGGYVYIKDAVKKSAVV